MRICSKGHRGDAHLPPHLNPKTNKIYDRVEEPGKPPRWRTWWEWFSETRGEAYALAERQLWLEGKTDVRGGWWCGHCLPECKLIDLGEQLGYPDTSRYSRIIPRAVGYEQWQAFAREQSGYTVAALVDKLTGRIKVIPYAQQLRVHGEYPFVWRDGQTWLRRDLCAENEEVHACQSCQID